MSEYIQIHGNFTSVYIEPNSQLIHEQMEKQYTHILLVHTITLEINMKNAAMCAQQDARSLANNKQDRCTCACVLCCLVGEIAIMFNTCFVLSLSILYLRYV